ncbi:sigma-70 family RNA polymerase sigma factor [Flavobacteriaceae bacterium 3-367]|uniref:RNA polymerase sigma factor n=1 Tax=Eudoraea algarum TaxID=3417568 RepID=UPI003283ED24
MPNQEQFVQFINDNDGILFKVSTLYTNSQVDAQDLRQEMIYQLWRSFGSFSGRSKFSTWMYRVALNTAMVYIKKKKRTITSGIEIDEKLFQRTDVSDNTEEQQIEKLYETIKRLNNLERGIIMLYLENKSYDEIGEIIGFTTTNVGTRISRIKEKLKKLMQNK